VDIALVFVVSILRSVHCGWMQRHFHVRPIGGNIKEETSAVYLQVSIVSQALIFVTRSRSWSFVERPGLLLMSAFVIAQLVGHSLLPVDLLNFLYQGWEEIFVLLVCVTLTSPFQKVAWSYLMSAIGDRTTDSNIPRSICKLGICPGPRHRVGMGGSHLAVQPYFLPPS
jgi:hypothetical protein